MSEDITGGLDLLGDWLDAKGYTEEAGLCTRAMDEINRLRDGVRSTIQERDVLSGENWELRAENEKLRAALKPFADRVDDFIPEKHDAHRAIVTLGEIRAAAAALKEMGE